MNSRCAVAPGAPDTWSERPDARPGEQLRVALGALLVVVAIGVAAVVIRSAPTPELRADTIRSGSPARPIAAEPAASVRPAPRPVEGVLITHAATEAAEQAAAQAAAAAAAARAAALAPRTGVDWDSIADCETGGNWRMQGPRYSGGLGFANTTWSGFGGREFAANAGQASREEQIHVAERVYARYGLSGWGCKRYG